MDDVKKHMLICLFLSMSVGRVKEWGIYYKERNEIKLLGKER
jgi:hypothetical protein